MDESDYLQSSKLIHSIFHVPYRYLCSVIYDTLTTAGSRGSRYITQKQPSNGAMSHLLVFSVSPSLPKKPPHLGSMQRRMTGGQFDASQLQSLPQLSGFPELVPAGKVTTGAHMAPSVLTQ